jgi:hypothetical protein
MTEDQYRKWDTLIKGVITPIIAVVTVLVGVYQYTDGQARALEKEYELKKIERQDKLREEKTALYKETRQTLSFLSTNTDVATDLYKAKKTRFWELYWGDLAAVETPQVESLMVKFGQALNSLPEAESEPEKEEIKATLQQLSLTLAHQTSEELKQE